MEKLKTRIGQKCENAVSIVLIPDGWTSPQNSEYLGFIQRMFVNSIIIKAYKNIFHFSRFGRGFDEP
jgi:hypothetical protein